MKFKTFFLFFVFFSSFVQAQEISLQDRIKNLHNLTDSTKKVIEMGSISYMYQYQDSYKSVLYADSALKLAKKIGYKQGIAKSYNFLGLAYAAIGKLDFALKNYLDALSTNKDAGLEKETSKNLNNIAEVLITIGDINSASIYVNRAYAVNKKYNNLKSLAISLSLMSDIYLEKYDYKNALYYLEKANAIKNDELQIFDKGFYFSKLGKIDLMRDSLEKASNSFDKVLNFENAEPDQIIKAYTGLAIIKSKQKDYAGSKILLNKALSIAKKTHAEIQLLYIYEQIIRLSKDMNDLPNQVIYLNQKDSLKSQLLGYNTSGNISSSLNKIITDKKDKENEELRLQSTFNEKKLSKQKNTFLLLITGISVLLILGFVALINFRNKNKAYKKLDIANQQILKHNANLEQMVQKRTATISQKNAKLKEVAYFNSHRVRKHMANILGLIHVASFEKEKQEFFDLIESEAKSMDETLSEINAMTND
ncbi:hypothetical protein A5893_13645 [Pedobacter psychrophilus]|uniref:MalT-like TPR region domain-containing protein n=1 Tax=Pedobacter psychrophilus TaxID=1826909 RepID=A0A179DC26_9SPHI|nr:tetratricopeptide repeat protein [Pedobacter psychrophilus]OAQ38464.1 hypothetical protein A5893_13645 [Pedobacter psychrophilus]